MARCRAATTPHARGRQPPSPYQGAPVLLISRGPARVRGVRRIAVPVRPRLRTLRLHAPDVVLVLGRCCVALRGDALLRVEPLVPEFLVVCHLLTSVGKKTARCVPPRLSRLPFPEAAEDQPPASHRL